MDKGVYILLIEKQNSSLPVGSLGTLFFRQGWYVYVGSALGTGGFARVLRHLNLNRNKNKNPRWHIDYLLLSPSCCIRRVYCITTTKRIECIISRKIDGEVIPNFGSSDCSCMGHLFYYPSDPHTHLMVALQTVSEQENIGTDPWIFFSSEKCLRNGIV